jgi:hypothetical protein
MTIASVNSRSDVTVPLAPAPEYDRHIMDDDDQKSISYMAMEHTSNAIGLPSQPVHSTAEHEEYVSLNISRDSDEDRKKSVYHKTTEVSRASDRIRDSRKSVPTALISALLFLQQLAKAYAAIMQEEAALSKTIGDIRLPGPIPESGMRDIEEALMGDYKDRYDIESKGKGILFWMPEASAFEDRLKNSQVDNLILESAARRYRFLVPFIIKSELSPGLAFAEGLLAWIHFLNRT